VSQPTRPAEGRYSDDPVSSANGSARHLRLVFIGRSRRRRWGACCILIRAGGCLLLQDQLHGMKAPIKTHARARICWAGSSANVRTPRAASFCAAWSRLVAEPDRARSLCDQPRIKKLTSDDLSNCSGDAYAHKTPAVAGLTLHVAELGPGTIRPADRVPETPIFGDPERCKTPVWAKALRGRQILADAPVAPMNVNMERREILKLDMVIYSPGFVALGHVVSR
jgi:hypothetical protein